MIHVREFMAMFPDEAACREHLYHTRWPRGFYCTKCGDTRYSYLRTRNLYECIHCKTQTSITSGTVMHRTKLPLRYWMLVFYWVASGERCSARKIAKTLTLNYKTAFRLLHAVRQAIGSANGINPFAFWRRSNSKTPVIVRKAKSRMWKRAEAFIHLFYGRTSRKKRVLYYEEYLFRSIHSFDPSKAVDKLIQHGSKTIPCKNNYKKYPSSSSGTQKPPGGGLEALYEMQRRIRERIERCNINGNVWDVSVS